MLATLMFFFIEAFAGKVPAFLCLQERSYST